MAKATIYSEELRTRRARISDGLDALSRVSFGADYPHDVHAAQHVMQDARRIIDAQIEIEENAHE